MISFFLSYKFSSHLQIPPHHLRAFSHQYIYINKISLAINSFQLDCNSSPENLDILVKSNEACWLGPYLRDKELIDRFGHKLHYIKHNDNYTLVSVGQDGILNTDDDLSSSDSESKINNLRYLYREKNNCVL